MLTLALPAAVLAQTPPPCHRGTCTVTLAPVHGRIVVYGCGEHATLGQMRVTLSSSNPNVTRGSFNTSLFFDTRSDVRAGAEFLDWEWRSEAISGGAWQEVRGGSNSMTFAGGQLGENIIEVRPKAGAHIWSNRRAGQPIQGPGQLVVPVISQRPNPGQYTPAGSAYFLFFGGKGCARVNAWGETDGSIQ